jgi:phage terminase large subunit-like protein
MDYTTLYANDVISGKQLACKYVILACERHVNDLKRAKKKDFEYTFNIELANKWFTLYSYLRLWKGEWAGNEFILEPWQKFIIGSLFGWVRKDNGVRRFKKAYIEMARKNAKTTLMAGIAIGMMTIDGEHGAQVYAGATKEDQAKIVVNDVANIVRNSPIIMFDEDDGSENFKIYSVNGQARRVVFSGSNSFMSPVGRDSKSLDGLDVSCGIIDEYHAHPTDDLKQVIESGMGARKQPLLCIITTAGFNKQGPCYQYRRMITEVLEGIKHDENTFGIIYTLDDEDDWQNPESWIKSNPNLNVSVKPEFLKTELTDALNQPSKQTAFLTKNLNLWVDAPTVWIPNDVWDACEDYHTIDELSGECYAALDLASTGDITALMLYFPELNYFKPVFFCPKETASKREKKDSVPYTLWAREGWLNLTDGGGGKVTDYNYIKTFLQELNPAIELKRIAFDKWNSSQLINDLKDVGLPCEPYSQALSHMSYPTKEFEKMVMGKQLKHDGSPVMAWMMKNVALMTDSNDNIKIDKKKSHEKVDGPVSAVMALGQCIKDKANEEQYYFA